ncbi:hypothetical protein OG746_31140 [Streptomyces sp. NBC_01016]|uniref:hypothetical protein n=1 Tax=Streptomyces sp. NBC_01016 TaxID=2903720 RepID=UPI002250679C|nr:hypothetical protein [Streptomyces sp. NBC_01016]MCX4833197.1 hypothetical protein [Streptomyces sp. NBC_01016]
MTGIGPVEPHEPAADRHPRAPHPTDVFGADSPRPYDRWTAQPPRRRRLLAGLLAVTAAAGTLLLPRPERPHPGATRPLPRALDMTYLDLTLTNRRARELHSFIFVERYPHDLLTLLRARCKEPRTELTQR